MSKVKNLSFAVFLCLFVPTLAFGKAAYYGKDWMIKQAEIIAIVDISSVDATKAKGKSWTYNEVASAKVERVLKGQAPAEVKLHGKENFICAQVRYKPGKALVFLRHDENLLVGVNWHLGVRQITGDKVEWFADERNALSSAPHDLKAVVDEIETAVNKRN